MEDGERGPAATDGDGGPDGEVRLRPPPPARRAARSFLVHPLAVLRRLLAEHATPRGLAAAAALGVIVGALPLIGLHTVAVYYLAGRLRLNRLMALATNQLCIPPVVPALCIEAGYLLRHRALLTEVSLRTLGEEAPQRLWEWAIGALVVGPALGAVVGGAVWALAATLQRGKGAGEDTAAPAGQP